MSHVTPTTQELADNLIAQLQSELGQSFPYLPRMFQRVLAKALAALIILLYKYAGWMVLQQFVAHASFEETTVGGKTIRPLVEWGRTFGAGVPDAGERAELTVDVTVQTQSGSLDKDATQLVRPETGVVYLLTQSVALDAPTKQITVRAVSDQQGGSGVGTIGNLSAGDTLRFANPLPNVAREAVVVAQTIVGADAEGGDAYRARVLDYVQFPPHGGALTDYRLWGKTVSGVVNIYPYTGAPNEMDVFVEADEATSGNEDGVPLQAQLELVKAAIEFEVNGKAARRPAGVRVNPLRITRLPFDVEVTGLTGDDVPAAQALIEEALDDHMRSRAPFILGLSVLPRLNRITLASVSGVVANAADSVGATTSSVQLKQGTGPILVYQLGHGELAKLGAVTFV